MASVSQGTTVSWGGAQLGEIVSVNVSGFQADTVEITPRSRQTRDKSFSVSDRDIGSVSVTCRSTAVMVSSNVGLTAVLNIGGPDISMSFPVAIFQSFGWSASVGELQTYTATFKLGV